MHVFLTGDVGVGKSTAIQAVLAKLPYAVGGFYTRFGPDPTGEMGRALYLCGADETFIFEEARRVVAFEGQKPLVYTERFDRLGSAALRRARERGAALIVMDECGRFEGKAYAFQREIFTALDGGTPVLGVVRQGYGGWLDDLRSHPGVTVCTVTTENRDRLPAEIMARLGITV